MSIRDFPSYSNVLLVLVVGICISPHPLYSASQDDSEADKLYNVAIREFGDTEVTEKAANALRNFIAEGLKTHPEADMNTSETAIKRFADEMLKHAQVDKDDKKAASANKRKKINLKSFEAATGVCPLYPFC
jgi:hypothetical protein